LRRWRRGAGAGVQNPSPKGKSVLDWAIRENRIVRARRGAIVGTECDKVAPPILSLRRKYPIRHEISRADEEAIGTANQAPWSVDDNGICGYPIWLTLRIRLCFVLEYLVNITL
jgi:hypothetical protein